MKYVIELCIVLVVLAYLMPIGLQAIAEANMTGVNTAVTSIFTIVLPILAILGVALGLMPPELKSRIGL